MGVIVHEYLHGKFSLCDSDRTLSGRQLFLHVKLNSLAALFLSHLTGFGLKDTYDQDTDDKQIAIGGTGRFDIMSNSHGWDHNTLIPGHMSSFSRLKTPGWLEPIEITRNGFYAIQPAEISGHIYKISHNFPDGEYLLIENRQPIKVRFLCCT